MLNENLGSDRPNRYEMGPFWDIFVCGGEKTAPKSSFRLFGVLIERSIFSRPKFAFFKVQKKVNSAKKFPLLSGTFYWKT